MNLIAISGGIEQPVEEGELFRPSRLGLGLAVAARHGVVEPTVRGTAEHPDGVIDLIVLKAIAEAPHIIEGDDVVCFPEGTKHGAVNVGDYVFEGAGLTVVGFPFSDRGCSVPN